MLHLFIKNLIGDTIVIEVESDSLVKKIKEEIKKKNDILPYKQTLMLNRKELEDDKKISQYNIKDNDTIHLMIKISRIKINIIHQENKSNTELEIDFEDTIEKVKDLYIKKTDQKINFLVYSGKLLKNEMKVKDYEILENSNIYGCLRVHGGKK